MKASYVVSEMIAKAVKPFKDGGGEGEREGERTKAGAQEAEVRKMDTRDTQLICSLLLCVITQIWGLLCSGPCQCPPTTPRCPAGVPLVSDHCGCCQVCAGQEGEACSDRLPCDDRRGLQCDYSASFPGGLGQCVGRNELGCEMNGRVLEEGQTFQPSCSLLCQCLGGGVTCVTLCGDDLQRPADDCHNPQLVRLPRRCCKTWLCGGFSLNPSAGFFPAELHRQESYSISNCIEWTSDWSPCSHSCGPGVGGVREQLQFTSVPSAGAEGLLEHQSLPSQVLRLDLSRGTLLQPLPHQDSADGFPLPRKQANFAAGDDDRVLLLQHLQLPLVHSCSECPALAVSCTCIHPQERQSGPVLKERDRTTHMTV
ncbi:CCN family member 5-like isoform 2-T4 [Spinachia spinachia]